MMKSHFVLIGAIAGLTIAMAWPSWSAPSPAPESAQKIATCNISAVFNQIKEFQDLVKDLEKQFAIDKQELDERQKELVGLNDNLKILVPGSAPYDAATKEINNKSLKYKADAEQKQIEIEQKQKQIRVTLWQKIHATAIQIAKTKGFTMVIADQSSDVSNDVINDSKYDYKMVTGMILGRTLIYTDSRADVTKDVVLELDRVYAGGH